MTVDPGVHMKQKQLTKTFMIISNCKNSPVHVIVRKFVSASRIKPHSYLYYLITFLLTFFTHSAPICSKTWSVQSFYGTVHYKEPL